MRTMLRGKVTLLFMMLGLLIAVPAVALADQLVGDGDTGDAVATPQQTVALGTVAPGAQVTKDASFTLLCNSAQHIERSETLSLNFSTADSKVTNTTTNTVAASGGVSVVTTNTDPLKVAFPTVPTDWPLDNDNSCGTPARTHGATDTADITITAPTQPGTYSAVAVFNHVQSAEQPNDISGNSTTITYNFTVPSDTQAPSVSSINRVSAEKTNTTGNLPGT